MNVKEKVNTGSNESPKTTLAAQIRPRVGVTTGGESSSSKRLGESAFCRPRGESLVTGDARGCCVRVGGAKAGSSRPETFHFRGRNPHAFVSRGILVALFNGNVETARARDAHLRGLISNPDRAKANGTLPASAACLPGLPRGV